MKILSAGMAENKEINDYQVLSYCILEVINSKFMDTKMTVDDGIEYMLYILDYPSADKENKINKSIELGNKIYDNYFANIFEGGQDNAFK